MLIKILSGMLLAFVLFAGSADAQKPKTPKKKGDPPKVPVKNKKKKKKKKKKDNYSVFKIEVRKEEEPGQ